MLQEITFSERSSGNKVHLDYIIRGDLLIPKQVSEDLDITPSRASLRGKSIEVNNSILSAGGLP
jgi:hypothetical protein